MRLRTTAVGLVALATAAACAALHDTGARHAGASLPTLRFDGESVPYSIFGVYVLPGQTSTIELVDTAPSVRYGASAEAGALAEIERAQSWSWTAPQAPGTYRITLSSERGPRMRLNAFVMVPADELRGGRLRGYEVGRYPDDSSRGRADYRAPAGFVEVTAANASTRVSPHFRLGQFVCKQQGGYPKFVVLRERLVLALERILEAVTEAGHAAPSLHVMSGYRTPVYNTSLGNVARSRHLFGDAADVFVDAHPRDGRMDDLNHDGRIDVQDAAMLYDLIAGLALEADFAPFDGGLGLYDATVAHGPFVHIDTRGYTARWGRERLPGGGPSEALARDPRHGPTQSRAPAASPSGAGARP